MTTLTTNTDLNNSEKNFSSWAVFAFILLLGICGTCLSFYMFNVKKTNQSQIATLLIRLKSETQLLINQMSNIAQDMPVDFSTTINNYKDLQSDLNILQKGGNVFGSDKTLPSPSEDYPQIIQPIQKSWSDFDAKASLITSNLTNLKLLQDNQDEIKLSLIKTKKISQQLKKNTETSTGTVASIFSVYQNDLNLLDDKTLLTLSKDKDVLKKWLTIFETRIKVQKDVSVWIQNNTNLTSQDKTYLFSLLNEYTKVYNFLRFIYQNNMVDITQSHRDSILSSGKNLTETIQTSLDKFQQTEKFSILNIILVVSLLITLLGFSGLVYTVWQVTSLYGSVRMGHYRGHQFLLASDKITKKLKKTLQSGVYKDLGESPDSPAYAMSSLIDQLLFYLRSATIVIKEQSDILQKNSFYTEEQIKKIRENSVEQQKSLQSLYINHQSSVKDLMGTENKIQQILTLIEKTIKLLLENEKDIQTNDSFMENIREKIQNASKRTKRLGETTQNIQSALQMLNDNNKKIKILSLNLALEASNLNEDGRVFSILGQELDRLTQNGDEVFHEIETQIDSLQLDVKESILSIESGTADVVKSAQLLLETEQTNQSVLNQMTEITNQNQNIFR